MRTVVDLPAPLAPSSATISPGCTLIDTSRTAERAVIGEGEARDFERAHARGLLAVGVVLVEPLHQIVAVAHGGCLAGRQVGSTSTMLSIAMSKKYGHE